MDRRAWQAIVHRVTKSWTRLKQLTLSLPFNTEKKFDANSQMHKLGRNRHREIKASNKRRNWQRRQRRKSSSH